MTDKRSKGAWLAQKPSALRLEPQYVHDLRLILLEQTIGATWHEVSKLVGVPERFDYI